MKAKASLKKFLKNEEKTTPKRKIHQINQKKSKKQKAKQLSE
jgi:hypothetical protein